MELLHKVCCGIDVHKKVIVACLRINGHNEVRTYGSYTNQLLALADWLSENNCTACAMESTGSYWKPVYNILEANDLEPIVVNAQHMKAVPGRKTDVKDAEWIAELLAHGLLSASFIPTRRMRELRELCGYRKKLVQTRTAELNRLQKTLEGANIKLSGTVSDINGMSAGHILDHILSGLPFDSKTYDDMKKTGKISHHLKASKQQLIEDMNGCLSKAQTKAINIARKHIKELTNHINELNEEINTQFTEEEDDMIALISTIPGISTTSAEAIISVIGIDMSRFPTDRHLASWAGLSPGNNESAGKKKPAKTRKGNYLLKTTLVCCAHSAVKRRETYFHSLYSRISAHRGKKRAIVAVAHSMIRTIYQMLKNGTVYEELGGDYHEKKYEERSVNRAIKKLKQFGYDMTNLKKLSELTVEENPSPAPA